MATKPPQSSYPFNDNTRQTRVLYPNKTGLTPSGTQDSFDVTPNQTSGKSQRRDYTKKGIANFIFPLDAAFDQTQILIEGTVFWVSSSDQTAFIRIQVDGGASGPAASRGIVCRNGFRISGVHFDRLYITNSSAQAGLTIELSVARDYPDERIDVQL